MAQIEGMWLTSRVHKEARELIGSNEVPLKPLSATTPISFALIPKESEIKVGVKWKEHDLV